MSPTSIFSRLYPNHLGSIEWVTNADGRPVEYFWYSPWGETLHEDNSWRGRFRSPFKFTGHVEDEETGLTYAGARYYPARVGKWLSVDPLAGHFPSWTPYHYVHNNPVNLVDPDGRSAWWPGVTTTYLETRAAIGVGVGFNFIRQSGVARDEVGKTHFISQSQVMVDGSRPGSIGGGMVSLMAGVSQDFKHETFLGQQLSDNNQFSAGAAAGPAVSSAFGDGTVSLAGGIGLGGEVVVGNSEIAQSISLTYDQAKTVNKQSRGNQSWGVTNIQELEDGTFQANVTIDVGKNKRTTEISVFSQDRKMWMSTDYVEQAVKVEGL